MALLLDSRLRLHAEWSRAQEVVVARTTIPDLCVWELGRSKCSESWARLGVGKVSANLLRCENILRHFPFHERCGQIRKHNLRVQSSFDNLELFLLRSPSLARFIYFLHWNLEPVWYNCCNLKTVFSNLLLYDLQFLLLSFPQRLLCFEFETLREVPSALHFAQPFPKVGILCHFFSKKIIV